MTASTSRQPQSKPSVNGHTPARSKKNSLKKGKGKGKEQVSAEAGLSAQTGSWNESEILKEWDWVSLTGSSASKHPPIFTKDGR
jgi:hypothetical protein